MCQRACTSHLAITFLYVFIDCHQLFRCFNNLGIAKGISSTRKRVDLLCQENLTKLNEWKINIENFHVRTLLFSVNFDLFTCYFRTLFTIFFCKQEQRDTENTIMNVDINSDSEDKSFIADLDSSFSSESSLTSTVSNYSSSTAYSE